MSKYWSHGAIDAPFYFLSEVGAENASAEAAAAAVRWLTENDPLDPNALCAYGPTQATPASRDGRGAGAPASMSGPEFLPTRRRAGPITLANARDDFPILQRSINGRRLVWLDNAATTQKPWAVIDRIARFYAEENSNVHRGAHTLAAAATDAYEAARATVARFLGAATPEEIIFVRGATEAINLVARTMGRKRLGAGDEIVLTQLEHHSNIVPWQFAARDAGAVLRVAPVNDRGEIMVDEFAALLGPRTRIVSIAHVSNALGTILPVREMAVLAHRAGAVVVVDGAQGVPHVPVDVQEIDCDFYAMSGHKLFGPTGVGVLYGKRDLLEEMPPWQGGGSMIDTVTFDESTFAPVPAKFEAGTAILAGAVGLGAAMDYVSEIGMDRIAAYEQSLMQYASAELDAIPGLRQIGTAREKAGSLSFVLEGVSVPEIGKLLDAEGIAVRAGHHCAQPALRRFGLTATVRPSLAFYNTRADINALTAALRRIRETRPIRGG